MSARHEGTITAKSKPGKGRAQCLGFSEQLSTWSLARSFLRTDFEELRRALRGKVRASLSCVAFDLLRVEGRDLTGVPLIARKETLATLLDHAGQPCLRKLEHLREDGNIVYVHACDLGLEGTVSRWTDRGHIPGKRS